RVDEAERDEIVGGIAAFVAGVRPLVALELAALGARDIDLVAVLDELPVGVRELRPPEADRPTRLLGDRRVGGQAKDALWLGRVSRVDCFLHVGAPFTRWLTQPCHRLRTVSSRAAATGAEQAGEGEGIDAHHPCRPCSEKPRSLCIAGSATITIAASRITMKKAPQRKPAPTRCAVRGAGSGEVLDIMTSSS